MTEQTPLAELEALPEPARARALAAHKQRLSEIPGLSLARVEIRQDSGGMDVTMRFNLEGEPAVAYTIWIPAADFPAWPPVL